MIDKVKTCTCFFAKKGFKKDECYFYEQLDKGTLKVWYVYRNDKSDYDLMSVAQFNSQFKRTGYDKN